MIASLLLALFLSSIYSPFGCNAFVPPSRIIQKPIILGSKPVRRYPSSNRGIFLSADDENHSIDNASSPTFFTPADRPLLALVDTIGLIIFALIGKSSHSADGSLDLMGVLFTAFPFVLTWLTTSPITGVYSPDERGGDTNVAMSTAIKVAKGWAVAVPLGIAMRGLLKGYVPPVPFIVVTMISTLVILALIRLLFNVVENFFVEFV